MFLHSLTRPLRAVAMIGVTVLLAGCQKPLDSLIVGKWAENGVDTFEFFRDGTVRLGEGTRLTATTGTWEIVDDDRVKMSFLYRGTQKSLVMDDTSVDGKVMTAKFDGKVATLRRMD